MKKQILYVGLDVHKKNIDVAVTDQRANGRVRSYGKIDGAFEALDNLVRKLKSPGAFLHFFYEAGGESAGEIAPRSTGHGFRKGDSVCCRFPKAESF